MISVSSISIRVGLPLPRVGWGVHRHQVGDGPSVGDVLGQVLGVFAVFVGTGTVRGVPRRPAPLAAPGAVLPEGAGVPVTGRGAVVREGVDGPALATPLCHDGRIHEVIFRWIRKNHLISGT